MKVTVNHGLIELKCYDCVDVAPAALPTDPDCNAPNAVPSLNTYIYIL